MSDPIKVGDMVEAASFIESGGWVRGRVVDVSEVNGRACVTIPYLHTGTLRTSRWRRVEKVLVRKNGRSRWLMPPARPA